MRFNCTYNIKIILLLQLNQVDEYMRYRKLPQDVRQQITEYYEHRYRRKFFNEEAILNGLSQGLKEVGLSGISQAEQ